MFCFHSEEKENAWLKQRLLWQRETDIWDELVVDLFENSHSILRNKLESALQRLEDSFKSKLESLDKLKLAMSRVHVGKQASLCQLSELPGNDARAHHEFDRLLLLDVQQILDLP